MSYGYGNSDDPEALAGTVRRLTNDIDLLRNEMEERDTRVDRQVQGLRDETDSRIESVRHELTETTDTATATAAGLQKLTDRVEWLSRYLRRGNGIEEVDLDDVGRDVLVDLGAAANGRTAARGLLTAERRASLQVALDEELRLTSEWQSGTSAVLQSSRDLLDDQPTPEPGSALRARIQRYRTAEQAYRWQTIAAKRAAGPAAAARTRLSADTRRRAQVQAVIDAGETAGHRAHTRLRTRIIEALSDDVLLPEWFVTTLGFTPPTDTSAGHWLDTAASLLAFRVTYEITTRADAFGPEPDDDPERTEWRKKLQRDLRRL